MYKVILFDESKESQISLKCMFFSMLLPVVNNNRAERYSTFEIVFQRCQKDGILYKNFIFLHPIPITTVRIAHSVDYSNHSCLVSCSSVRIHNIPLYSGNKSIILVCSYLQHLTKQMSFLCAVRSRIIYGRDFCALIIKQDNPG